MAENIQNRPFLHGEFLRSLWHDHVQWTREVIVTAIWLIRRNVHIRDMGGEFVSFVGEKAYAAARDRLLLNQEHIALYTFSDKNTRKKVKEGYEAISEEYEAKLKAHIVGAQSILQAIESVIKDGGSIATEIIGTEEETKLTETGVKEIDQWYDQADDIAITLMPYLQHVWMSKAAHLLSLKKSLYKHLWQTLLEALQYLNEEYKDSIETYEEAQTHMAYFSDSIHSWVSIHENLEKRQKKEVDEGKKRKYTGMKLLLQELNQ
jgi:hypothetical protein